MQLCGFIVLAQTDAECNRLVQACEQLACRGDKLPPQHAPPITFPTSAMRHRPCTTHRKVLRAALACTPLQLLKLSVVGNLTWNGIYTLRRIDARMLLEKKVSATSNLVMHFPYFVRVAIDVHSGSPSTQRPLGLGPLVEVAPHKQSRKHR